MPSEKSSAESVALRLEKAWNYCEHAWLELSRIDLSGPRTIERLPGLRTRCSESRETVCNLIGQASESFLAYASRSLVVSSVLNSDKVAEAESIDRIIAGFDLASESVRALGDGSLISVGNRHSEAEVKFLSLAIEAAKLHVKAVVAVLRSLHPVSTHKQRTVSTVNVTPAPDGSRKAEFERRAFDLEFVVESGAIERRSNSPTRKEIAESLRRDMNSLPSEGCVRKMQKAHANRLGFNGIPRGKPGPKPISK